jgi:hypothetical protein
LILRGLIAVLQSPLIDCVSFDPFGFEQDGFTAPELYIGSCEITKALVSLGVASNAYRPADSVDD